MFAGTQRSNPKRPLLAVSMAVAALLMLSLGACTPAERSEVLARVNDQDITLDELLRELRATRGPSTLVEMIDAELIREGARRAGIEATGPEMALRLERAIAQAGSEADMNAMLQKRGITREQFEGMLRQDQLLDKLGRATMTIPEQEIADYYAEHRADYAVGEQVRARMILLSGKADAEAVLDALKLPDSDFAGLASALSLDPATKERGGDMGWFEREDYVKPIADAAFALQPGEVSGPIEAPDGWAIIQLEERRPAGARALDEVRLEIRGRIERDKLPSAREAWIRKARADAVVLIADPDLRAATEQLLREAPAPEAVTLLPMPPPR